jgi:hypothetical protein
MAAPGRDAEVVTGRIRHQARQRLTNGGGIMAQKMTRGEVQDLLARFATENPRYREALIRDPKAIVEKQLNTSLGSVQVKSVVETADTNYVVIPYLSSEGELSDADLERVAGGKQDITAECTLIGLASAGNTVSQVIL